MTHYRAKVCLRYPDEEGELHGECVVIPEARDTFASCTRSAIDLAWKFLSDHSKPGAYVSCFTLNEHHANGEFAVCRVSMKPQSMSQWRRQSHMLAYGCPK